MSLQEEIERRIAELERTLDDKDAFHQQVFCAAIIGLLAQGFSNPNMRSGRASIVETAASIAAQALLVEFPAPAHSPEKIKDT
jgi:hypothetical protein